jgi:hypothetical protein
MYDALTLLELAESRLEAGKVFPALNCVREAKQLLSEQEFAAAYLVTPEDVCDAQEHATFESYLACELCKPDVMDGIEALAEGFTVHERE